MARQPKRICRTRIVLSSIETGWAGSPGPKEVNRPTEAGCPGSLAFGDPGDREPQPDHSRISDVPVVSPARCPILESLSDSRVGQRESHPQRSTPKSNCHLEQLYSPRRVASRDEHVSVRRYAGFGCGLWK